MCPTRLSHVPSYGVCRKVHRTCTPLSRAHIPCAYEKPQGEREFTGLLCHTECLQQLAYVRHAREGWWGGGV